MQRALRAALAPILLSGCGAYSDFRLPMVDHPPAEGQWMWHPRPGPVLTHGETGAWDAVDTLNPSVVRQRELYFNFYSGFDGKTWHTGLAVSKDDIEWTRKGSILSPEGWEGTYMAANGSAMRTGGEFLYWYEAGDPLRITLARGTSGETLRRHGQPVMPTGPRGSWDERAVADPYVIRSGGVYYMYYLGQDRAARQRLGVARSPDGIHWAKLRTNPVLGLGEAGAFDESGLGEPAVWFSHGSYWMLYTGRDREENRRMGMARSQDGVHWKRLASPVIGGAEEWDSRVVCDASVEAEPHQVRVWFGGGNRARPAEGLNGQIGYGVLQFEPKKGE